MEKFEEYYDKIVSEFQTDNLLVEIEGDNDQRINWPKEGSGVYVVWEKSESQNKNILYVGMTGKFKRETNELVFKNRTFKERTARWTPYRFRDGQKDSKPYAFGYGPKLSNVNSQSKIKYDDDAYREYVTYNNLVIHCFTINADHQKYSPALLEAEMLTKYLKDKGNLPPANNEL